MVEALRRARARPRAGRGRCSSPGTDEGADRPPTRCSTRSWCDCSSRKASTRSRCVRRSPARPRYGVCAQLLRTRSGARPPHQHRRGGRRDRRAVDRRARHAADHAYLPHRRRGLAGGGGQQRRGQDKGTLRFHHIKTVQHEKGHLVAVSRSGEIGVVDEFGRERERYKIPYGATINVEGRRQGRRRPGGGHLGSAHPSGRDGSGRLHPVPRLRRRRSPSRRRLDEITGLSCTVVLDPKQRGPARTCAR